MKKLLFLISLFFSAQAIAFDPIEDGFARAAKALQKNNLKQAAEIWLPLAERGHAGSQIYFYYVITQDLALAKSNPKVIPLLKKSAKYNEWEQVLLWKIYTEQQEFEKADYWLKKLGKTKEEADQLFQKEKVDAKTVLDDFMKLYP
ncbi:hypothetical protein [Mannheimia indoligenes]|uniref:hypothetical protein n=1 Tax=Mannheimia indoligenes TaxID=3103145 RepID=UPI002FE576FF